jgi:hypothetical protein
MPPTSVLVQEPSDLFDRGARAEHPRHAERRQLSNVFLGNDAAYQHPYVVQAGRSQHLNNPWHQRHMSSAQQRQPKKIGVFIGNRADYRFRRLPEAGVNHMESRIAQAARDHFESAVVPVKTDLGQQDAQRLLLIHQTYPVLQIGF